MERLMPLDALDVRHIEVAEVLDLVRFVFLRRLAVGLSGGLLEPLLAQFRLTVELGERGLLLGADGDVSLR